MARVCKGWRDAVNRKRSAWQQSDPGDFEWEIPHYRSNITKLELVLSPTFFCGEENWWLILYPEFQGGKDQVALYLAPALIQPPGCPWLREVRFEATIHNLEDPEKDQVRKVVLGFRSDACFTKCGKFRPMGRCYKDPDDGHAILLHKGTVLDDKIKISVKVRRLGKY